MQIALIFTFITVCFACSVGNYKQNSIKAFESANYLDCLRYAEKGLKASPEDSTLLILTIKSTYFTDQYSECLKTCTRLSQLYPHLSIPYFYKSKIKRSLGDYVGSLSDANQAVQLDSSNGEVIRHIANLLELSGELNESLTFYIRWSQIEPQNGEPLINIGNLLHDRGDKDSACYYWRKASDLGCTEAFPYLSEVCQKQSLARFKPNVGWKQYVYPDWGFSVYLPEKPAEEYLDRIVDGHKVRQFILTANDNDCTCQVLVYRNPGEVNFGMLAKFYEGSKELTLGYVNGTLLDERDFSYQRWIGREYIFTSYINNVKTKWTTRILLIKGTVFSFTLITLPDSHVDIKMTGFFNSINLMI
jgi:tetratricopeptide (TPR) repeat protein